MIATQISGPTVEARFLRRVNRFLLQVRLGDTGEQVEAHMADPGRLRELLLPGRRIWLQPAGNPSRRTHWTAVLVESPDGETLVSLDSALPNRLIRGALKERGMEELAGWHLERSEFPVGRSRLDFLLSRADGRRLALEVKSVTLVEDGVGLFPDAVTERGARHMRELGELAGRPGWGAAVLFVLQRKDAGVIRAARGIDASFADALANAHQAGVRVLGRRCWVHPDRVELGDPVPVMIE